MKPIYDDVAKTFLPESNVCYHYSVVLGTGLNSATCFQCVVANVDADAKANAPLATKYEIGSFPTIKFFAKDNKEPESYEGGRSEADFVEFLNQKCGTNRAVGGGLNEQVS